MRRIATNTKAVDLFGVGKHGFKDGDLGLGLAPTDLNADFFNDLQEEVAGLIESSGIVLSGATRTQLAVAIQSGKLCAAVAAGTADAITAVFNPAITALKDGMILFVRAASANATVAPTFTPANGTIAAKAIVKGANSVLLVGDIAGAGHWIELQYDQTLDRWVLKNPATGVVAYAPFPAGTRMPFAQAAAPVGWTQDVSDNANNRMLRVVNTAGGGVGGTATHSPILMNVVPSHTHSFTTGGQSADHSHGIGDPGHAHIAYGTSSAAIGAYASGGGNMGNRIDSMTSAAGTGIWTGGMSVGHTHSGSTDNGSSQTNWQPRYIDLIICSKN